MADIISSLGYITKSDTKRYVKAENIETKTISASQQPARLLKAYFAGGELTQNGQVHQVSVFSEALLSQGDITNNSGIITINITGVYVVSGAVRFAANNVGYRRAFIADTKEISVNRYADATYSALTGVGTTVNVSGVAYLTAGTQIAFYTVQTSGGDLQINTDGDTPSYFSVVRLF
jgi:hypothetical protein